MALWLLALSAAAPPGDPPIEDYLAFATGQPAERDRAERRIRRRWRPGHAAMLLELARFSGPRQRVRLMNLLEDLSGERFRGDHDAAYHWAWARPYAPHPDYGTFKSVLYTGLDPRFATYFDEPIETARIRLDEVRWGGVRQDGIPPLDHPRAVRADEAAYLADSDVVFGVTVDGEARAYPKRVLAWHELVRDTLGGRPILGVYCTLCGAMIVYDPVVDGVHHELGTSGFLYRSNKLMYDRATSSLWSTLAGEPVIGPLAASGITLQPGAVVTTTWGRWRADHPDTTVLSLQTGHERDYAEGAAYRDYFATDALMFTVPERDERLANKAEVLVLRFGTGPPAAVVAGDLPPILQGVHGGQAFAVWTDAAGAHRVYDATALTLRATEAGLVDDSGAVWTATEHALVRADGASRPRLAAHRAFWFGWRAAFPDTVLLDARLEAIDE